MEYMLDPVGFKEAVSRHIDQVNHQLEQLFDAEALDKEAIASQYQDYAEELAPYIIEVGEFANQALNEGSIILAEGAQGTLLDLDHGTYPFVTSSTPTAPGALVGLGLGIGSANRVVGVVKAFQTRVGEGPFPTELDGDQAVRLRGTGENDWDEFGTTTGRPRRVGWLDIVLLRYAVRLNGISELALTKLDILSGLETIKLCTGYRINGKTTPTLPLGPSNLEGVEAIYEDVPGWQADITSIRSWKALPDAARRYISRIEELLSVPVKIISVGPERSQVVQR